MKLKRPKQQKVYVGAECYRATVFKVEGSDELGRPRECRMLREEESVGIEDGDEFIVAFVSDAVLRRAN